MLFTPLLFHFNQHLTEFSLLASQVCYRGLLQTLRANPNVKANIHISGTLITALKWLDPEPLEMIRDGVKDGQFEIVGSTFAQNVAYASDDWDNARQIELHKRALADTFGVTPTAFWNPERCWRQSLVPVIAGAGYKTITIEDHILEQSGASQAKIYRTRYENKTLNIVRDDEKLKHLFNFAAWFGETQPLEDYLTSYPAIGDHVLAYAEDSEAMGLWGYMQGIDPRQTWERLGKILHTLTASNKLTPILFSEIPTPDEEVSPIEDGAAAWMNASLAQTGLPYHEDGYADWFDFNANSDKLAHFREFYAELRRSLQKAEGVSKKKAAKKISQLGLQTYLTHQYEFGCIGIGGNTYRGWLGASAALVMNDAVSLATLMKGHAKPIQFTVVDEINQDGVEEWLQINEPNLLVTSPIGGRLLYWLDLTRGQLLVGNPCAVVAGKYEGDSIPPEERCRPNYWLPVNTPMNEPVSETPPTRMAKYLPPWVWENYPQPVTLSLQEIKQNGEMFLLMAQQGAFSDEIWVDGNLTFRRRDWMEVEGSREAVRFVRQLNPNLSFRKKYSVENDRLTVGYTLKNDGQKRAHLQLKTVSELALDYQAILKHGRAALDFLPHTGTPEQPGVVNPLTGDTLRLTSSHPPFEVLRSKAMLGLNLGYQFDLSLAPQEVVKFTLQLIRSKK